MNNRLYGSLIFELSEPGRCGYSLPYATTQILAQTTSALTTASTLSVAVL